MLFFSKNESLKVTLKNSVLKKTLLQQSPSCFISVQSNTQQDKMVSEAQQHKGTVLFLQAKISKSKRNHDCIADHKSPKVQTKRSPGRKSRTGWSPNINHTVSLKSVTQTSVSLQKSLNWGRRTKGKGRTAPRAPRAILLVCLFNADKIHTHTHVHIQTHIHKETELPPNSKLYQKIHFKKELWTQ